MTWERQRFRADEKNIDKTKKIAKSGEQGNAAALLGHRLERLVEWVGKDVSVYATGKSWKQLRRYFGGADVPASVVRAVAVSAGVSCDFILVGKAMSAGDADVGRQLAERELGRVRKRIDACSMGEERKSLQDDEARLMRMADAFSRRRDEFHPREDGPPPRRRSDDKPAIGAPEIDTAILARLIAEIGEASLRRGIPIAPGRQAEIAAARYADVVAVSDHPAERRGALKMALTQIERDLMGPDISER